MEYNLTLSRWHKVAERINAALREREADAKAALTATTISPWNKDGVEEKAAAIARRAADDLALIEVGTRAVARIRAALAIRNAELGVSAMLREKLAREQARATRLLDEVADLNREKLAIDVPKEVIAIAGLAA